MKLVSLLLLSVVCIGCANTPPLTPAELKERQELRDRRFREDNFRWAKAIDNPYRHPYTPSNQPR